MPHVSILDLPTTSANEAASNVAQPITTYANDTQTQEQTVTQLRRKGLSIEKIRLATGMAERKIKALVKGVPMGISTPFDKSVRRVYDLATSPLGIKDYELRSILHAEYGTEWNESEGRYESGFGADTIKRVKQKVREQAASESNKAIFVMDWVDEQEPTACMLFLEQVAIDMVNRVDEAVDEFMERHCTLWREDSAEADEARRKQAYAARRHLLKLISDLGGEPITKLLERTRQVTDALQGTPDLEAPSVQYSERCPIPEPSRTNHFLDYVESQGWLKKTS